MGFRGPVIQIHSSRPFSQVKFLSSIHEVNLRTSSGDVARGKDGEKKSAGHDLFLALKGIIIYRRCGQIAQFDWLCCCKPRIIRVDILDGKYIIFNVIKSESGGIGRRTGLRIQPAQAVRGSSPLSRTRMHEDNNFIFKEKTL